MKMVFVSDLQCYHWPSYPQTDEHGVNLRLLDTINELKRLHALCVRNGVEAFCVLGDIFEARSHLDVTVLNGIYESFYAFQESGIRVILLVGNHDRTSVGNDHALKVFKSFATVIDRPMTIPLGKTDLVGIPFHPKASIMRKAIHRLVTPRTSLLLLHCAIKSVRLPQGRIWGEGISLEDIPPHVTALLGHYHRWTELRPGKVWYLGSLGPVDFGDSSIDKFYAVYHSETGVIRFHHSSFPKFNTIELGLKPLSTVKSTTSLTPADLDIETYIHVIEGNFIRVKGVPAGYTDFTGLRVVLESLGARHVSFDTDAIIAQSVEPIDVEEQGEWTDTNIGAMMRDYIDSTSHNLDGAQLLATGLSIVEIADTPEDLLDDLTELESSDKPTLKYSMTDGPSTNAK